jgi:hypothetical protein
MVDLVLDLHACVARWKADAKADDGRGPFFIHTQFCTFRIDQVEEEQTPLARGRYAVGSETADTPDRWAVWQLRRLTVLPAAWIFFP